MRIRSIPFGYQMENGEIIPHEQEAPVVRHIFSQYLQGATLQSLADEMGIPYSEAKPDWNKHQVKRILDNRRYMGEDDYPALVSAADYDAAHRLKAEKFISKPVQAPYEIGHIRPLLHCNECGSRFRRQSRPYGERWICPARCGNKTCLKTDDLIQRTIDAMDVIAADPSLLWTAQNLQQPSLAATRLRNEWQREMGKVHPDPEQARTLLFQLAAEKYAGIDDTPQLTLTLRKAYADHRPDGSFNASLFERTVERVLVRTDGAVLLQMKNGQVLP